MYKNTAIESINSAVIIVLRFFQTTVLIGKAEQKTKALQQALIVSS